MHDIIVSKLNNIAAVGRRVRLGRKNIYFQKEFQEIKNLSHCKKGMPKKKFLTSVIYIYIYIYIYNVSCTINKPSPL